MNKRMVRWAARRAGARWEAVVLISDAPVVIGRDFAEKRDARAAARTYASNLNRANN